MHGPALTATNSEGQVISWGYVCRVLAPCLLRHFLVHQSLRSSSSWCIPRWQCFLQLGEVQAALLHQGFEIGLVDYTVPCVAGNLWASWREVLYWRAQISSVEVVVLVLEDSSSKLGERRWYSFVSPFHRKEIYQGIWTTVGLLGACHR